MSLIGKTITVQGGKQLLVLDKMIKAAGREYGSETVYLCQHDNGVIEIIDPDKIRSVE